MKKAIIIYGPPGAGKGTQANLLAWRYGFIHFDTGKYLEQIVHNPDLQNKKIIREQRKIFDSGGLMNPAFVLKITTSQTRKIAKAGFSIIFSGSPRTLYEAFGAEKRGKKRRIKGLIGILEKEYGKNNIYFIFLKIAPEVAIARNAKRLICLTCKNAILYKKNLSEYKSCHLCGGKLVKRTVDNPKVFKTRIKEYQERTLPILKELKKRGYKIIEVDGTPLPYKVHQNILRHLKKINSL